ncbi:MAG: threonylcarbamoyl-AMP synthase [Myxococcaceae bacterium]|nr:threonylcarbamoyl-AMP synthase [Myxococcaceae bacterium]
MEQLITEAVGVLKRGGLVALPTETVYGLGADAENELAVRHIFAVKRRPASHPLIVHVASARHAKAWARELPVHFDALARAFWPGPLTLVVWRSDRASDAVTGGQDTVALRVPDHPLALELLEAFGGGVAAPSANRFGRVSPTTAEHVRAELGADVDLVLDGGPCAVGVESTIVDLTGAEPRILRPGGVSREDLVRVLGRPVRLGADGADVRAPGMLASHYAPRAGVLVVTPAQLYAEAERRQTEGLRVAALAPRSVAVPAAVHRADMPEDAAGFARELYGALRRLDAEGFDLVVTALPDEHGLGLAVKDRLLKAAAPRT